MKKRVRNITRWTSILLLGLVLISCSSQSREEPEIEVVSEAEPQDYWNMFAEISLQRTFMEEAEAYYRIPIFTPELLAHAGKEVTLIGYYLPYSKLDSVIIISRFPNKSCFFCGRAGIESVAMVELEKKNRYPYRTDQMLAVRGKLTLNNSDIQKLAFVIEDAKIEELQ